MKIEQILIQPIGQRFNAGTLSIKTFKKTWQVDEVWWSQVICMDETGEMPVDVNVGKTYNPIRGRGTRIVTIIAEVQNAEYLGKDRKKLVVHQYSMPTITMDEYNTQEDEWFTAQQDQIKGKIRHGIVCSMIKRSHSGPITLKFTDEQKQEINELVNFVMTGE